MKSGRYECWIDKKENPSSIDPTVKKESLR